MTGDILGVSISGLRVSQNALRTAGHNIANADTEGYSRQSTDINSSGGNLTGAGFIGNGAYTARIERVVNQFVVEQIRSDASVYNELNAFNQHVSQLNDTLADTTTGLRQGMDSFFSALQNVTDDPSSTPSRQLLISEADNLSDRFNTLYNRIDVINRSANDNLAVAVSQVNSLTNSIARLNEAISSASTAAPPNDLLDQRDQAIQELSELVAVNVYEQDNDQLNITVGNGITLVLGSDATPIRLGNNEFDVNQPEIYFGNLVNAVTNEFSGGQIAGLINVKQTVIDPAFNEVGRIGIAMADAFNELQQQGITLNNTFGTNLFFDINGTSVSQDRILASVNNLTGDQEVNLTITDVDQLTTSDYQLIVSNSSSFYSVVRLSDNEEVAGGSMPGAFPASITFDGLSFNIDSGTFSSGDEFLIRPTRLAARDFSTEPLQPEDIALGSPVLTDTTLGNRGSAEISAGEVVSVSDVASGATLPIWSQAGELSPPLLVQFTTATTYDILDNSNPGNPVQLSPPIRNQVYVPGIQNSLFDNEQTQIISSNGADLGLPTGSTAVPVGTGVNGYPSETFTFTTIDPDTGAVTTQAITSTANASARTTAGLIDNVDGVSATAFNYLELRDFTVSLTAPLQITVNGEDLVAYDAGVIHNTVPSPALNSGEDFNDYLAEQINNNSNLTTQGIYAVSAYDATAGEFYIQIHSTRGDDLTVELEAAAGEVIEVNDGNNPDVALTGAGAGTVTEVVVGGQIDINLQSNIGMTPTPAVSGIFGNSAAPTFSQQSLWGIQANITGNPQAGDTFTIGYNDNAALDNRNGLSMIDLETTDTINNNGETFGDAYNRLLEDVGIQTNISKLNTEAAERVLQQSEDLRNSISGVNLDEEAADLIRYEQLYSANAQVINVARELFDRLINSF